MAFTKIVSPGIDTTGSYTVQELNTVGVMTAGTVQVGAATTVHTTGIDLGSGNITSHNINSTGIITATSFVGPVSATNGTFSGNVSIGGTLTYEDVTNVDSVGLITARNGITVTSGSVGIGTDVPEDKLHVFLNSSSDGPSLRLTNPNGGDGTYTGRISTGDAAGTFFAGINFLKHDTNDGEIRLRTKVAGTNTDVVTIVDGNVGIGITNSSRKLHINSGSTDTAMLIESTDGDVQINLKDANSSNGVSIGARGDDFYVRTGLTTERFRVTSDGNVGIGDNDPSDKLNVKGNSTTSSGIFIHNANGATNSSADLWFGNWSGATSAAPQARISALNKNVNTAATDLIFEVYTGSTTEERLRITSDGNISIGGVSPSASALTVKIDTNKHIGFNPSQSEVGNVPALVAFQDNGSLQDMGFRGVTLRFAAGNAERLRITNDGRVGLGTITPGNYDAEADNFVVVGSDHTGITIASTGSNKRTNLYFADGTSGDARYRGAFTYDHNNDSMMVRTAGAARLRMSSDGKTSLGGDFTSGATLHIRDSNNTTKGAAQLKISKGVGGNAAPTSISREDCYIHLGGSEWGVGGTGIYLMGLGYTNGETGTGIPAYIGYRETSSSGYTLGDLVFGTRGNTTGTDNPTERLRITSSGILKINPAELQTTAGDKFAQIRGGGVINTMRHATGHFANTATYRPQQYGYIGDYMHYGCNAVYFLAQTTTGNSGYSSHMFSWYDSGHWGHYGKFVLMCHEGSYIGGMAHRYLSGTTVTDIFNIGNTGSVSTTQTLTGSGTHSGQSVYRYDCTVSHTSTYRTMRWYLGLFHGAQLGVTGNGKTQSEVQTYANSNGSILHLFGVSDSNLTMAPNYRTW